MFEYGYTAKPIRLIRATLDGSQSSVRIAVEVSNSFVTLVGLKQGDALSNSLFNIALEGMIKRSDVQRNGIIITWTHMLLGFADDINIIGIDRSAVVEAFDPLKKETMRIGLTISSTKTKYIIAGRDRGRSSGFGAELVIGEDVF